MLAITHSGYTTGVTPSVCMVEAHRSAQGLPSFTVVGRRHDPRWLSAIDTIRGGRLGGRVTVNITHNPPSTMEGLGLAVVMATLATIPNEPIDEFGWVGAVQADGTVTASAGMIPVVKAMKDAGLQRSPPGTASMRSGPSPSRTPPAATARSWLRSGSRTGTQPPRESTAQRTTPAALSVLLERGSCVFLPSRNRTDEIGAVRTDPNVLSARLVVLCISSIADINRIRRPSPAQVAPI